MANDWRPTADSERIEALDVVRGIALFGVLTINALTGFRLSLFDTFFRFHTHADWLNRLTDWLTTGLLEFKAIALFSFLFGVGIGAQTERITARGGDVSRFIGRRFLALLGIGLIHMFVIWNGDILTLYAVCGLLLVPLMRLPNAVLVGLGIAAIAIPIDMPFSGLPGEEVLRVHADEATRIYSTGSWSEIFVFRWHETAGFIRPLLVSIMPRTLGLMLLGLATWRAGVLRTPDQHRTLLWSVLLVGGVFGVVMTSLAVVSKSTGRTFEVPWLLVRVDANVALALAYAAGLLLWLRAPPTGAITLSLAAVGQMALSNYVIQSVVLSLLFYNYGLGLFGRLGPAPVMLMCLGVFAAQLLVSRLWLRRFRFGPLEWLWRSLTYRQLQPFIQNRIVSRTP